MQIQISWLLQKPTDLDLHCLQRQGISGFSRTRVKENLSFWMLQLLGRQPSICKKLSPFEKSYLLLKKNEAKLFEFCIHLKSACKHRMFLMGFNDTSTFVGHFVSFPIEREKRDRRDSRDERKGQGRKRNRNECEETEEIKTFPIYPYLLQGQQALPNWKPR